MKKNTVDIINYLWQKGIEVNFSIYYKSYSSEVCYPDYVEAVGGDPIGQGDSGESIEKALAQAILRLLPRMSQEETLKPLVALIREDLSEFLLRELA